MDLFKKMLRMAKVGFSDNVEIQLRSPNGKCKKLFQPNAFYMFLIKKLSFPRNWTLPLLGRWSDKLVLANRIGNAGVAGIAARINGSGTPAAYTYIAIGIGTTAAADADTQLGAEITNSGGARANSTVSVVTTDVAGDTAQLVNTFSFTSGGTFAVTEAGVLNAASTGTLLARQVFTAVNVASGDSLQITWKFDCDSA